MGFEFWAFIEFSFCFCFFSCCLFFYLPDALEDADRVVAGAGEGDEGAGGHLADFQHRRGAAGADQRHQLLQVGRKRFRRRSTGKAVGWRVRTRRVDAEATEQQQDGKQRRIRPESTRFRSVFDAPTQLFFFFKIKRNHRVVVGGGAHRKGAGRWLGGGGRRGRRPGRAASGRRRRPWRRCAARRPSWCAPRRTGASSARRTAASTSCAPASGNALRGSGNVLRGSGNDVRGSGNASSGSGKRVECKWKWCAWKWKRVPPNGELECENEVELLVCMEVGKEGDEKWKRCTWK